MSDGTASDKHNVANAAVPLPLPQMATPVDEPIAGEPARHLRPLGEGQGARREAGCGRDPGLPALRGLHLGAKLLGVHGVLERDGGVAHLIAGKLTDLSHLLGRLTTHSRDFH